MEISLVIMAAGLGARYGGLKQLDACGPNGETLVEYAIYDALKAGFNNFVFVIRRETEELFEKSIFKRLEGRIKFSYVFQELNSHVSERFKVPAERKNPWGTGHAVLCAREKVRGPFAVINADDYYGPKSYLILADFLQKHRELYALIGYQLNKTLSRHGTVSRGICVFGDRGMLSYVREYPTIARDEAGGLIDLTNDADGHRVKLTGSEIVSLNMWGFQPNFFEFLEKEFWSFLKKYGHELKSEFYLPYVVSEAIENKIAEVIVLPTNEAWFGVTYVEELNEVKKEIKDRVDAGVYPKQLWSVLI